MKRGFTLIELLVCIGILALLVGILLPVFSNARKNGQKITCTNNLRSVAQSMRMYTDDNDGAWPSYKVWISWNLMETPKLTGCPMAIVPPEKQFEAEARLQVVGYACNQDLLYWNHSVEIVKGEVVSTDAPTTDNDIPYPAVTVAFLEAEFNIHFAYAVDPHHKDSPYPYGVEHGWERHNGGANYLFCDGHVKWQRAE